MLLNNLVENALRYSPPGAVVDVNATTLDGQPTLRVIDAVRAAEAERGACSPASPWRRSAQARSRLGRRPGAGIVRAIAERHTQQSCTRRERTWAGRCGSCFASEHLDRSPV